MLGNEELYINVKKDIKVVGERVLVEQLEIGYSKKFQSVLIPEDANFDESKMMFWKIVSVGDLSDDEKDKFKPDQIVIIYNHIANLFEFEENKYSIVNIKDILAVIEK